MKIEILNILSCPECGSALEMAGHGRLECTGCTWFAPVQNGVPLFTSPLTGLVPSEKLIRGPDVGTPWRQANWRFLRDQAARLAPEDLILDVGAGRGDFADLFQGRRYVALDVYPYPEVDIVCDLTQTNPFRPNGLDAILLMNVVEHVYDTRALLGSLVELLKPGGVIILAIPFLVKIHQAPIDFVRYTHFALQRLGEDYGLEVEVLEGYYDPVFFLGEGTGNLRWGVLPALKGGRRYMARAALTGIEVCSRLLGSVIGAGKSLPPAQVRSSAPTGYQVVYRKGAP